MLFDPVMFVEEKSIISIDVHIKKKIVEFFVDLFNVVSVCVCDEEIITRINNKQRFFGLLKNTIKFWKIIELLSKQ